MTEIVDLTVEEWDVPLEHPFSFALGTIEEVENVLVRVETDDGTVGYGEGCPFPTVTGETRGTAMSVVDAARPLVEGEPVEDYRRVLGDTRAMFRGQVNALFALEAAVLDAYTRSRDMPLSELFGSSPGTVTTDTTIPIEEPDTAADLAETAAGLGYDHLKIKTGGDLAADVARVEAVRDAAPAATLTVDANQAHDAKEAIRFARQVDAKGIDLALMEQPVPRDDLDGMARVRDAVDVPVAADESVFSPVDARRVVEKDAADIINIKMGKAGMLPATDIIGIAEAAGLDLMVGCMIESRIGIHSAAHLVSGTGAFSHVDLDAKPRHCDELERTGRGPEIELSGPGHGVRPGDVTFDADR